MSRLTLILCTFSCIVAGSIGFFVGQAYSTPADTQYEMLREQSDGIINPLIDFDIPESSDDGPLSKIIETIDQDAHALEDKLVVEKISIYYRDLKKGAWYGYNEHEEFAPASLLKVPLMLAYYKLAEKQPGLLEEIIAYDDTYPLPDQNIGMDYMPQRFIEKGNEYTVNQLLEYMIVYSDNNAKNLLYLHLNENQLDDVYLDLGMKSLLRATDPTVDALSTQDNATAYRILYNATYLTPADSRRAIKLLLGDTFADGVVAGLPKGVKFAGKYGERSFADVRQLHDCGIVYYPDHPYILCIMTRGSDYDVLSNALKTISADVYRAVDAYHRRDAKNQN